MPASKIDTFRRVSEEFKSSRQLVFVCVCNLLCSRACVCEACDCVDKLAIVYERVHDMGQVCYVRFTEGFGEGFNFFEGWALTNFQSLKS